MWVVLTPMKLNKDMRIVRERFTGEKADYSETDTDRW